MTIPISGRIEHTIKQTEIIITVMIKTIDRGPLFYTQELLTRDFGMYKFRDFKDSKGRLMRESIDGFEESKGKDSAHKEQNGKAMRKILTITVPTYNAERYLRDNLDSFCIPELLNDLEILIINDGSIDGSAAIAEEYVQRLDVYKRQTWK